MGEHLAANLTLVGVDQLVLGVDVDIDSGIVVLAERLDRGEEHLLVLGEHLLGPVERLLKQVLLAEEVVQLLEHGVTSRQA